IGAAFVPNFARLTQTLASSLVSQDYVQYPRTLGKSYRYIAVKHLLPNAAEPLLVYGATHLGFAIMAMAGLGFLGLGAQPPSYDWGSMLGTGIRTIFVAPGTALGP